MCADRVASNRPTAETLRALYVDQQLGCPEIGRLFGRDASTVRHWLVAEGIPTRPRGHDPRQHFKAGAPSAHKGRQHTAEAKRRIGAASTGRAWKRGDEHWLRNAAPEENPNWKGGRTPERQAFYRLPQWRAASRYVWARDNACCRNCGKDWRRVDRKTEPTFQIHHVWSFQNRETRADPALLVLLCRPCHLWVHSKANTTGAWMPQESGDNLPSLDDLIALPPVDVDSWLSAEKRGRDAYLRAAEREVSMPTLFDFEELAA